MSDIKEQIEKNAADILRSRVEKLETQVTDLEPPQWRWRLAQELVATDNADRRCFDRRVGDL